MSDLNTLFKFSTDEKKLLETDPEFNNMLNIYLHIDKNAQPKAKNVLARMKRLYLITKNNKKCHFEILFLLDTLLMRDKDYDVFGDCSEYKIFDTLLENDIFTEVVYELIQFGYFKVGWFKEYECYLGQELYLKYKAYEQKRARELEHDHAFINVAMTLSKLSRCQSRQVCAIAVKNNRIVAQGINGSAPRGMNCCDKFRFKITEETRAEHHEWSLKHEIHAEENLIIDASKNKTDLNNAVIYITLQPCVKCSLLLSNLNLKRIVYMNPYDYGDIEYTEKIMLENNILLEQYANTNNS